MKPVLLLLHGMLNDERIWAPVAAALADAAEVRVPNLHRHESIAQMADAGWALLADVAPERRLVIAGFSMGGYVALQMLAEPKRRVQALALVSTSARGESAEGHVGREKTIAALERDFAKVVDDILLRGTAAAFQADANALAALRAQMMDVGAPTAIRQVRAIMGRADQLETARALQLEACVLTGVDDRIVVPALAEEVAAAIPGATLERLPDCGHMAPLEQTHRVAAALRRLLTP